MDIATLLRELRQRVPEAQEITPTDPKWVRNEEPHLRVPAGKVREAAEILRRELGFDLLSFVTAVDWIKENRFELVYYLMKSSDPREKFFLKADLPREKEPRAPSVTPVWVGADWQEREIYDLYGIKFDGHPNLKRILLWEGYLGYPLRKDYVHVPDKYDNGEEIGLPGKTFAETPGGGGHRAEQKSPPTPAAPANPAVGTPKPDSPSTKPTPPQEGKK